jgi:glycerol uptake facilitator-like aquaporin
MSGAHFNPIVSIIAGVKGTLSSIQVLLYVASQAIGALAGVAIANSFFGKEAWAISSTTRSGTATLFAEVLASAGLIIVIFAGWMKISQDLRAALISIWIASAYFFTSSTSFANPVVSLGRVFTDSYAGISPQSFIYFALAQLLGGILAFGFVKVMDSQ